ncbi:MAG: nucleotide exchange factor GrpE [Candidatus Magasanikbacteria bacterium]|nr:nucleotide exchange factor GrpE [Candidatus Magasanikbacteria bacterium]
MDQVEKKYPIIAVGALIYNQAGKILLVRGPKFGDFWTIPGGKVDLGETVEQALRREIKEEISVEIGKVEFVQFQDAINPPSYHEPKHFLFIDFLAELKNGEPAVSNEITEFIWVDAATARQDLKTSPTVDKLIQAYLDKSKPAEIKNEDYKLNYQRALADYQNLKKETASRRGEWAQYSEQMILEEFIPVYDNFKKAYWHKPEIAGESEKQFKQWADGIGFIQKQFGDILKAHNVIEIKTVGEMFDPKFHETVGEDAVEGKTHGTIVREVEGGYTMAGRVIKVAKVIIAK